MAFYSEASNLVPGDTNSAEDVFVRDRASGTTRRVSVDSAGNEGDGDSYDPVLSADGRFVVFYSDATNLVAADTNGVADVFLHDCLTGVTTRLSVDSAGNQGNGASLYPWISADGRTVTFHSSADNLVPLDTNQVSDVFVRDLVAGTTVRVSVDSAGAQGNGDSSYSSLSADGRYVAFESLATNLVPSDTNNRKDIFVRDLVGGTTRRVSVHSSGAQSNGASTYGAISGDGRSVGFESLASNLVTGDTNGFVDSFVHDLVTGTTERISLSSAGVQGNNISLRAVPSHDGRFVAFKSHASNLVAGDTNGAQDIFLRDRLFGTTQRVSVDSSGAQAQGHSSTPALSADGRHVGYYSFAENLVPGD